jgi:hypothetical protein
MYQQGRNNNIFQAMKSLLKKMVFRDNKKIKSRVVLEEELKFKTRETEKIANLKEELEKAKFKFERTSTFVLDMKDDREKFKDKLKDLEQYNRRINNIIV